MFGQGPIVNSLRNLATRSGFDVLLFDHHELVNLASYCDQYTGLVSLFHEHDLEFDILSSALQSDLFYIGALGSKRTHETRLKQLSERGVEQEKLAKIHAPVGLDIGAITPQQIAVSIVAEMIAVMNHHAE